MKNLSRAVLDKRIVDRSIERQQLTRKEFDSYLKSLPDESGNCHWVQLDMLDAEIGESSSDTSDTEETEGT